MFQSALSLTHGHQSLCVSLRVSMSLYVFVYACALETWAKLKDTDTQQPIQEARKKIRDSAKLFCNMGWISRGKSSALRIGSGAWNMGGTTYLQLGRSNSVKSMDA